MRLDKDTTKRLVTEGRLPADTLEPRPAKYRNVPETVDGVRFDSRREARRWCELRLLAERGEITTLERQVRFPLHGLTGETFGTYVADFTYRDASGRLVVEDAKGVRTAVYRLKKRALALEYGIEITEV